MKTDTKPTNPMKVITGKDTRWCLCQRLGGKVHQWWCPQVLRIPHHPQNRYRHGGEDQGRHSGSL